MANIVIKKDIIIPTRKEKSDWKKELYDQLTFIGSEREGFYPRKRDSFETLMESFFCYVSEYNDGYCSEWEEADTDRYCAYLQQEYRFYNDMEHFEMLYETHTFEESKELAREAKYSLETKTLPNCGVRESSGFVVREYAYDEGEKDVELDLYFQVIEYMNNDGHRFYGVFNYAEISNGGDSIEDPDYTYTSGTTLNELAEAIHEVIKAHTKEYMWELYKKNIAGACRKFMIISTDRTGLDLSTEVFEGTYGELKEKVLSEVVDYSEYESKEEFLDAVESENAGLSMTGDTIDIWIKHSTLDTMVWKAIRIA